MSHVIQYRVLPKDVNRTQFLAEVIEEVEREDWAEGGTYGGSNSLTNKSHWHDQIVYPNKEKAEEAIERYEGSRSYCDHAVLFHDNSQVKDTKAMQKIKEHIASIETKRSEYYANNAPRARKSKTATCPNCGSRVNAKYIREYDCPVCRKYEAFMSPTVHAALDRYDERIIKDRASLKAQERNRKTKGPVCWLAKYEYHV